MSFNKKFFTTGGIVASAPPAAAVFDPLQNFETVTYTGNGSTQKITGYIRKGAAFNGSTSHIDIPSTIPYTNTDFTFSCWFNLSSAFSSGFQAIIGAGDKSTGEGIIRVLLRYSSANNYTIEPVRAYSGNSYYTDASNYSAQTINAGTWYHLSYTYSATGNTAKIYLNGSLVSTTNLTTTSTDTANTGVLALGQYRDSSSSFNWNGKLDQVRFFNTELDSTKVGQLAAEDYSKATKSTTDIFGNGTGVALYELDEDANSSNFEQAAVFNGSSSYISGLNGVIPATTTDCTFSCWFNMSTGFSSNFKSILGGTGVDSLRITINYSSSGNYKIQPGRGISSNAFYSSSNWSATAILPNLWYHLVCVYTNSSNTMDVYLNNNLIDSEVLSTTTSSAVNTNLVLGYYRSDVGFSYWNGSIDQVRIYSSALGTGDVEKLYKESADVPTANLVAHYKLDGNAEDVLDTYDGTTSNVTYSTGVYGGTPTNVNFLGMAFQPDLVWIKSRDATPSHKLFDSVRGINKPLSTNGPDQEYNNSPYGLTSFDSNGFTIADITNGGYAVNGAPGQTYTGANADYVAWCWKAADTTTTISAGTVGNTIASDVRANQAAGFSIVKWTANGGDATIGHGISTPELIIAKRTDSTSNWAVQVPSIGNGYLLLNSAIAYSGLDPSVWNNTAPTSEVFSTAGSSGEFFNTGNFIAYCFHSVDGYQKVGSYSGSSPSDTTVTTGFRPRFVMIKRTNTTGNWNIWDSIRNPSADNDNNNILYANKSDAETDAGSGRYISFDVDGFTISGDSGDQNASSSTYIYLAIA